MADRRFESDLSVKGINNLIKQLNAYKKELEAKNELFVERLAEIGIPVVEEHIAASVGDSDKSHDIYITVRNYGAISKATLVVQGKDLLFIEFGAGVHFNTPAGTSPHPKGQELGYTIGSYGKGQGARDFWVYYDTAGEKQFSQGTMATMPLYSAYISIKRQILTIAKEVFGG